MMLLKSAGSLLMRSSLLFTIVFTVGYAKPAPIMDLINMVENSDLDLSDLGFLNPLAYMSPFDDLFDDENMLPFYRFLPEIITDALDDFPFDELRYRLKDVIHGQRRSRGNGKETIIRESIQTGADGKPQIDVQYETHNFQDGKDVKPHIKRINATGDEAERFLERQLENSFEVLDSMGNIIDDSDEDVVVKPTPSAKVADPTKTTKVTAEVKTTPLPVKKNEQPTPAPIVIAANEQPTPAPIVTAAKVNPPAKPTAK